ncbi:hypothetical protein [Leifsonia virtsii]|uniref:Uncharacterized protein n=1 Tax=Leifsonia virtsii TaxID=3035915 RepID=A0ABT8IU88_9MICO|nr:hypothetical protein [Leifsonia virtsii]MDN4596350.1 hypothetical protein [Leifsonia virtsii]
MESGSSDVAEFTAVRHPSTATAVRRLGGSLPFTAYALRVSVAGEALVVTSRSGHAIVSVPASDIRSIGVGEVSSAPPMPVVALAILVTVDRAGRETVLPVVPVGEDGGSLTWRDADVRSLADRLRRSLSAA